MQRQLFLNEIQTVRLPQPPPRWNPAGFVLMLGSCLPGQTPELSLWQQFLYQQAWQEAQTVVRLSLPERDLAGVWN